MPIQLQALAQASIQINSSELRSDAISRATEAARSIIGTHQAVTSFTVDANWAAGHHGHFSFRQLCRLPRLRRRADGPRHLRRWSAARTARCGLPQAELEGPPGLERASARKPAAHPPMRGWLAAPAGRPRWPQPGCRSSSPTKYAGDFNADDEAILVQLAQMASVAAENTRLFEASARRPAAPGGVGAAVGRGARARAAAAGAGNSRRRQPVADRHHAAVGRRPPHSARRAGRPHAARHARTDRSPDRRTPWHGVRRLIAGLRPPVLDDLGLLPAVRQLAHELEASTGLTVSVEAAACPTGCPPSWRPRSSASARRPWRYCASTPRLAAVAIALHAEHGTAAAGGARRRRGPARRCRPAGPAGGPGLARAPPTTMG